jgi:hypothetical protein
MRIFLMLIACSWIWFASLTLAQPLPYKGENTKSCTHKTQTKENFESQATMTPSTVIQPPTNEQTKSPKPHSDPSSNNLLATWANLLFMLALVVVGSLQWLTYRAIHNTTKIMERAYVVMSHSPPGLIIDKPSGQFWVQMQVGNFGHTPARVVRKSLMCQVLPKNSPPPDVVAFRNESEKKNTSNVRLVAQDKIFFVFSGKADDVPSSKDETKRLWLYGFVDYIDQFGQPDFAPYIRAYEPRLDDQFLGVRNNLVFED